MRRRAFSNQVLFGALGGLVSSCSMIYSDSVPASKDSGTTGANARSARNAAKRAGASSNVLSNNSSLEVHAAAGGQAISPSHPASSTPHDAAHLATPAKIDASRLPHGDPGISTQQVVWTDEQPARGDGVGAFRTVCQFSHMNYDDPIVFPKQPGKAHLHTYFGNTGADADTSALGMRSTGNSTCRGGTLNRTGYWVPALLDAQSRPLEPDYMDVYYKSGYNGIQARDIQLFPTGLRMVAGDMRATSAQRYAYWGCRDHNIGHVGSMPDCPAGDALAMIIEFPQCWDGKNKDSSDHKSHMAYPQGGACPATHPVPIPAITFNIYYNVTNAAHARLRLSSDTYDAALDGGYSIHGDWFDGWDRATARTFVQKCIQPGLDCHSHLLGDGRAIE